MHVSITHIINDYYIILLFSSYILKNYFKIITALLLYLKIIDDRCHRYRILADLPNFRKEPLKNFPMFRNEFLLILF